MNHFSSSQAHSRASEKLLPAASKPALRAPIGLRADVLAERVARKNALLQRRHTLADVINQYMHSGSEVLKRDPGRLTPLRMWSNVLGHRLMDEITGDEVAVALEMYAEQPMVRFAGRDPQTKEKIYREHGTRSAATVNRAKVILSAVFAYAKENALLSRSHHSPTRDIRGKGFNAAELPDRALSVEEVRTLLAHAKSAPWLKLYLFVLMAVTTGARCGELRQLRGRDLALDVEDPHAIVGLRRSEKERAGTKNGAVKVMPLSPMVVAEIRKWGVPGPDELLFPSKSRPKQAHDASTSYAALMRKLKFKNKRLHDLRHTAGTLFANEGKSESQIAALLGHKTLSMVPRYTRVQAQAKTAAVKSSTLWHLK